MTTQDQRKFVNREVAIEFSKARSKNKKLSKRESSKIFKRAWKEAKKKYR